MELFPQTLNSLFKGYLDCLAVYKSRQLVLVDWKTSGKKKSCLRDTFDNPLQIAAYAGAVNNDERYAPLRVNRGLIVVAYNDGRPADVIKMGEKQLMHYWKVWMERLRLYRQFAAAP